MAVVLMGRERDIETELESVRDLAELGPDDMRTLVTGFFAYSGSFTVDAEAGTVTHHIEAAFAPNWIGSDRVRAFEILSENRILLRPREGRSQLTWQREH